MKEKYGDERRTKVVKSKPGEISEEELIENKEVIVVMTKDGYIKQVPREIFRVQNRGGKGVAGIETKETDSVYLITRAMSHDYMLYYSNMGRVFQTRVWDIPVGSRTSKGKAIVNLLTLRPDEKITSFLCLNTQMTENADKLFVLMITKNGNVKKTPFTDYTNIRSNGLIAIKLEPSDELLWVKLTDGNKNVMLVSKNGKGIVFKESEVRPTGRSSQGVKGIELGSGDEIVSADVVSQSEFNKVILVLTEKGIGKKTKLSEFKGQHRGGKGVKVVSLDDRLGKVAFVQICNEGDTTVIITSSLGQIVKIDLKNIPLRTREGKGVILMRFSKPNDKVVSATFV